MKKLLLAPTFFVFLQSGAPAFAETIVQSVQSVQSFQTWKASRIEDARAALEKAQTERPGNVKGDRKTAETSIKTENPSSRLQANQKARLCDHIEP